MVLRIFLSFSRNGTSMISLIIPPKDQISRVSKMLADEFGTASNIKSRVNRLSVLGAITSVQHRLKLYTKGKKHLIEKLMIRQFNILMLQYLQMVWSFTVEQSLPRRERKRRSTLILSPSNPLILHCICAITRYGH